MNNSTDLKLVFEKCRGLYEQEEIKRCVWEKRDRLNRDIFDHLVEGIVNAIESCNYPRVEIIGDVMSEFAETIANKDEQKAKLVEKKEFIEKALLERTDLTYELQEELRKVDSTA